MFVRWLFLDMNSFFAAVEQQEHRELRGKPVAVIPVMAETTSCIAASYEARAFGVKTGTRVDEAKRLCPNLHIIVADPNVYRRYSDAIRDVVDSCLPVTKILSVDEMVCRLWGNETDLAEAIELGRRIKEEIHWQVGASLNCSVGLGPNLLLAKVAAELIKPNGLSVLDKDDLPCKLFKMELTDWPGISSGMAARFEKAGVRSTEQMYALPIDSMKRVFGGVEGERWWRRIRGEEVHTSAAKVGSINHSYVLPPELRTRRGSEKIAARLLEKAAERLRFSRYHASALSIRLKSYEEGYWDRSTRIPPCRETFALMQTMRSLGEHPFREPRQVSVTLSGLIPDADVIPSLFESPGVADVTDAVDSINRRYGRTTVCLGSVLEVRKHAQDKIAFGRIADLAPITAGQSRLL